MTSSLKPGVLKNTSLPHENSEIRSASSSVFVIVAKNNQNQKNIFSALMTNSHPLNLVNRHIFLASDEKMVNFNPFRNLYNLNKSPSPEMFPIPSSSCAIVWVELNWTDWSFI